MNQTITLGKMVQLYDEQVRLLVQHTYQPSLTMSLETAWYEFQMFTPYLHTYNQIRDIRFFPFSYVPSDMGSTDSGGLIMPDYMKNNEGEFMIQFGYNATDKLHPCDWWGMFLSIMYQDFPPTYRHIHTIQDTSIRRLLYIRDLIPECDWLPMIICHHIKTMIGWGWLYMMKRSHLLESSALIESSIVHMYPHSVSMQSLMMNGLFCKLMSHFWFSQIFHDIHFVYAIHFPHGPT